MRLQISKSKNAESFYIVESTYINGKRSNRIVEKLGTLEEIKENIGEDVDPYEWGRNRAKYLTMLKKDGVLPDVVLNFSPSNIIDSNVPASFNCGYLFLQKIYYQLGIDKICKDISKDFKFSYDLNDILSKLVFTRMLFPASKRACFKDSKSFLEAPSFSEHDIYRALEVLAKSSDFVLNNIYSNSEKIIDRNCTVLYYDCTNYFFEIEKQDDFRRYGVSKENRPNPIVQMGLFMDASGIPLAFSINPGNTNEQLTLKPLEKKIIDDFKLSNFVVCTDAGLSSNDNRIFNSMAHRFFVTSQSIKKLKGYLKDWALDSKGWSLLGSKSSFDLSSIDESIHYNDVFFKERWINDNGIEQRLCVTFSIKYRDYQANIRDGQVVRAENLIKSGKKKIECKGSNDTRRFIKQEHITNDGEYAENDLYFIDQDVIDNETKYDGFYAVCTNLECDIQKIIKINHERWKIEESFRIIKSEFRGRPIYLQREDRIKAHFLTCFISLLIYRILEKRLDYQYSCEEILATIKNMNFFKKGDWLIPSYTRTELTDKLHNISGFRTDYEIYSNQNVKKLIKTSKKKNIVQN